MVKNSVIVVAIFVVILFCGCKKSENTIVEKQTLGPKRPGLSFYELLTHMEETKEYVYDFQKYIGYGMSRDEEISLDQFGSASTWTSRDTGSALYIRTFKVGSLGIVGLLHIVSTNEDRLEKILDITTFHQEGKQVYFSTLWEPVYPPGSQGELPYRLGVYFYTDPDEIKPGKRIRPDYIIDMKEKRLFVHEPSGDDERLFLYRDPGPM